MTASDYIKQKLQAFGKLSEAELLDIVLDSGLDSDKELKDEEFENVNIAIAKFIPSLLLRPKSVSEDGISFSWDFDALKDYYAYLCRKYDLTDELNEISSITDASNEW